MPTSNGAVVTPIPPTKTSGRGHPQVVRNDQATRDALVLANRGLAGKQVKRLYRIYPDAKEFYPPDDAWQDSMIGLMRAADLWDAERAAFSTYATHSIRRQLYRHLAESRLVRVPEHVLRQLYSGKRADWFIAERKVIMPSQVIDNMMNESKHKWFDPAAREMPVPDQAHLREGAARVRQLLKVLPKRYAYVIEHRFFHQEKLDTVAAGLGVSRERVRQMEVEGLDRLRKHVNFKHYRYSQFF